MSCDKFPERTETWQHQTKLVCSQRQRICQMLKDLPFAECIKNGNVSLKMWWFHHGHITNKNLEKNYFLLHFQQNIQKYISYTYKSIKLYLLQCSCKYIFIRSASTIIWRIVHMIAAPERDTAMFIIPVTAACFLPL